MIGERPPRDGRLRQVEVEGELAATEEVHDARRVEQGGDLGEAVAATLGRDRCELRARVRDERRGAHSSVPSSASSLRLSAGPAEP